MLLCLPLRTLSFGVFFRPLSSLIFSPLLLFHVSFHRLGWSSGLPDLYEEDEDDEEEEGKEKDVSARFGKLPRSVHSKRDPSDRRQFDSHA